MTSSHAKLVVESIETSFSMRSALVNFAGGRLPAILESSRVTNTYGRFSVLACDPAAVVTIADDTSRDVDVVGALQCAFSKWPMLANTPTGLPTCVGWIGYLSYEAGLPLVGLASRRLSQGSKPHELATEGLNAITGAILAQFCLYDHAAVYDAWQQEWFAVAVEWPANTPEHRPSVTYRLAAIRALLGQNPKACCIGMSRIGTNHVGTSTMASNIALPCVKHSFMPSPLTKRSFMPSPLTKGGKRGVSEGTGARIDDAKSCDASPVFQTDSYCEPTISPSVTRQQYFQQFDRAMSYIEAGDIYEVNLAIRFDAQTSLSPIEQYLRLRESSPSTHAAFLPWCYYAILSTSPELFLKLREGHVTTRPIKGTRPRADDCVIDEAYRRDLASSEKDRAELNMIVDLMRNDLGRVCDYGSVRVTTASAIEALPTVFQQAATIEGGLAKQYAWPDLLRATFPGGSITGAPKIRAMQIIEELEPAAREVYCGSIGIIGLDGSMALNIAIRTMVQQGDRVRFWAGGAIVADSDPQSEYDEIMTKTVGLCRALVGVPADVGTMV